MTETTTNVAKRDPAQAPHPRTRIARFEPGAVIIVGINSWRCTRSTSDPPGPDSKAWVMLTDWRR